MPSAEPRAPSSRSCSSPRDDVNVYLATRRRTRLFRRVAPGETEHVPGNDSTYRADVAWFYGRPTSDRQNRNAWEQQVRFRVVCRPD